MIMGGGHMAQSVRFMPVSIFGAVMGIAGLALVSRNAARVLGVPAWIGEAWAILAVALFAVLLVAWLRKIVAHPDAARAELTHPGPLAFVSTLPTAMALAAGALGPHWAMGASILWWTSIVLIFAFQAYALGLWLRGGVDLSNVNTGWMIMMIGPVPMAAGGVALGELEAARVLFGIGVVATPFVMGLAFHRTIVGPALPPGMRPTSFILLVPPGLACALVPVLWDVPGHYLLDALYYFDLVLCAGLIVASRDATRWPFTPAWWAMTFPLDALASAGLAYAQQSGTSLALALGWATWILATAAVLLVLVRSVIAVSRGVLFIAPPIAPAVTAAPVTKAA